MSSDNAQTKCAFFASRDEINGIFIKKNIFFLLYIFNCDRFFALNGVMQVRTLPHINDDVAECAMSAKTETIGAGVEKVKFSAKSRQFYYQNFLGI